MTRLLGQPAHGVHESLSLKRLRSPVVRGMLPFRMPRALGRGRPVGLL
jgi:carotenoid 1,2-hydratase